MRSIIASAEEYGKEDGRQANFEEFGKPRIMVIGIGGAGGNTINRLNRIGIKGAETIAINTDKQDLDLVNADKKLLIGKSITKGLGAGGYLEVAKRCAEESKDEIESLMKGANLVFIAAGMGGGTGTGASPTVAEIAKREGAIVTAMVSTPFRVERSRLTKAEIGLEVLRKKADSVVILDNNRLLQFVPDLPIDKAFSVMDQLISETIKGISETIVLPSLINLDFADVKTIVNDGGVAAMLCGEGNLKDPSAMAKKAMNHPLLEVDYRGAKGCLLHLTGGPDMTLEFTEKVAEILTEELDPHAEVILGARVNKDLDGKCRVMAIMTGVSSPYILSPEKGEVHLPKWNEGKSKFEVDIIG
jgi:cell division protein FtsZ